MPAFNFRGSQGYVTDNPGEIYVLAADTYPTTRGGATFGWIPGSTGNLDGAADRSNAGGHDVRLAGINYKGNLSRCAFRCDLDAAGTYSIRMALGDASFAQGEQYAAIYDGAQADWGATTGLLATLDAGATTADQFADATGTKYSATNWGGSNTPVSLVFTTTIFHIQIGNPSSGGDATTLAHLNIAVPVAGPAGPLTLLFVN